MKTILTAIIFLGLTSGFSMAGDRKTTECPMTAKSKKCAVCPEKLKGVRTVSRNTANGVEITMSAVDKELAARIQEMALVHYNAKDTLDANCPGRVEGARTNIINTETGAKVEITGTTPEMIKKIQEASVKGHGMSISAGEIKKGPVKKSERSVRYICPMGCATSDKPGKCPKCGMQMQEKK